MRRIFSIIFFLAIFASLGFAQNTTKKNQILVGNGAGGTMQIAQGTSGQILSLDGSLKPTWTAPSSVLSGIALLASNNLSDVNNANTSLNNLLPSQGSNAGKFLQTDGTNTSWVTADIDKSLNYTWTGLHTFMRLGNLNAIVLADTGWDPGNGCCSESPNLVFSLHDTISSSTHNFQWKMWSENDNPSHRTMLQFVAALDGSYSPFYYGSASLSADTSGATAFTVASQKASITLNSTINNAQDIHIVGSTITTDLYNDLGGGGGFLINKSSNGSSAVIQFPSMSRTGGQTNFKFPDTSGNYGDVLTNTGGGTTTWTPVPSPRWITEVPTGTQNSSNTVFTLSQTPVSDTTTDMNGYKNGMLLNPFSNYGSPDYTISGTTITYLVAPAPTDHLLFQYRY